MSPVGIALFCTSPEYLLMKRPKKEIWTSSGEEAIKHDKFNMALHIAEFFLCWMTTEVSDDLLENSVMSDHSKDTTVIVCSVLALM